MGTLKLVMIQSNHRFGLAASLPNLSESSLADVGCEGSVSEPERSEGERSEAEDGAHPAKLDSANLATKRRDQTGGLIES